jgi:ubiquinone biosynthesis protein
VIAGISHLVRLGRAGFVFAREGVFALVDTRTLPLPAKTAIAAARLFERPNTKSGESRLAAALTTLGPTYVKLGLRSTNPCQPLTRVSVPPWPLHRLRKCIARK